MSEDTEHQKTENTATPSSNQSIILGIVMGAVVLLLLLLVISQQFNKNGGDSASSTEISELRKKISDQQALNEKLRYSGLPGLDNDPEALVTQIKSDTEALARLVNASASDVALLRTAQDSAAALSRRNQDLEAQLRQYATAAGRVTQLEAELDAARQAANGMVSRTELDRLRSELDLAKAERTRLQNELSIAQSKGQGMVDGNTYAILKQERDTLANQNIKLRSEIQRLMAELAGAKLFVSSEDLSPRAVALYRALKQIENDNYRDRLSTYADFSTQIKASVREAINFKTGSAQIAVEHEAHIDDMMAQADPNSFFLVVGYASTSGDSKSNEELSSQRATRVASMVNYHKKAGQGVQAVYLGEGKRFGPEDPPNQVCEVWEIRP